MKTLRIAAFLFIVLSGVSVGQVHFYLYKSGDTFKLNPWLRYTSVEGAFGGLSAQYAFTDNFQLKADAGYAVAGKFPRYRVRLDKSFAVENNEWVLSAEYHRLTDTPDHGVLPDWQNSFSALLFRRDFYQHYEVHGAEAELGHIWEGIFAFKLFGGVRDFNSMSTVANFSLLGWAGDRLAVKSRFPFNPRVVEGRDYYGGVRFSADSRPSPLAPVSAWMIDGQYTNSSLLHRQIDSDLSYQHLIVRITRQQMVFKTQRMMTTVMVGSFQGERFSRDSTAMAEQFLFDGGGYGSLRGYSYREFANQNRMALLKWDYSLNGAFLPKTFLRKVWGLGLFFSAFDLAFFADAGYYWTAGENRFLVSPSNLELKSLRADAGVALSAKDWIRFEFAFPLRKGITTQPGSWSFYVVLRQNL
ncbi:MAG: BamA/TamA family outer membrane protein [Bacteroidetes bacterium]|nr:BamA/TamA family outer membrane protein [Bacteroidota bacterium]